jgi:hypothetical protein
MMLLSASIARAGGRHAHRRPGAAGKLAKGPTYTRTIGLLDGIKRVFTGAKADAEDVVEGGVPVATPQGEDERETSTNAQTAGASDEPWPGND